MSASGIIAESKSALKGLDGRGGRELSAARWIVAQEGSRETYAVPLSLNRLGLLRLFCTDIWCRYGRTWLSRGPKAARALASRYNAGIPDCRVVSLGLHAIRKRSIDDWQRGQLTPVQMSERYCQFGTWFANAVRQRLERLELDPANDLFFGYNTNCLETLEWLRRQRMFTVVDQVDPGRVEEDLVIEESERWPGWAPFPGRMSQAYWDRLKAEWDLADLVVVNSEWSATALVQQGVPIEKLAVVPLAVEFKLGSAPAPVHAQGTLKVLWLGNIILRKGIQYLVEAARQLQNEDIEFLLAGPVGISESAIRRFPANIKFLGRITRDQLGAIYRQAHVFVLPTLSDGFAVTQLEAMAHALPVIATPNCGRVVTDGHDGLVVPARDGAALAAAIARLHGSRELLRHMSAAALETAKAYDLPSNGRILQEIASTRRLRHTTKAESTHRWLR